MKKILSILILIVTSLTSVTNADFTGPDNTPKYDYGSVLEVLRHPIKNAKVTLKGYIVDRVDHNKYTFQDNSGKIIVAIKDKLLADVELSPTHLVQIYGRVHRGSRRQITIDVQHIQIIK
jgi:uncharacterized protein (TIGR00156 family)